MTGIWAIAPFGNMGTEDEGEYWVPEGFDTVWRFDREHNVIAVGWDLGNLTGASKEDVKQKYALEYGRSRRGYLSMQRFWIDIRPRDIVVARRGYKGVVGLGKVSGKPFYDTKMAERRRGGLKIFPYPNFLPVEWASLEEIDLPTGVQLPSTTVADKLG